MLLIQTSAISVMAYDGLQISLWPQKGLQTSAVILEPHFAGSTVQVLRPTPPTDESPYHYATHNNSATL